VLINTNPEKEHQIYNQLLDESKIVELRPLFQEYDLIAKVKIDNKEKLGYFISNKIRPIDGVIDTKILQ
jgi:DNA-binding Lrp family transcriptional regulator